MLEIMAIPLTQGLFALVDGKNYERLNCHKWYAHKQHKVLCYATRKIYNPTTKKVKLVYMHRELLGLLPHDHKVTDHENYCGLDNRETNIRICTQQQNTYNRRPCKKNKSGYKGVFWNKQSKKWRVQIYCKGDCFYIGCFDKKEDGAKAYDKKAIELFGEFAYLNFEETKWKAS